MSLLLSTTISKDSLVSAKGISFLNKLPSKLIKDNTNVHNNRELDLPWTVGLKSLKYI